MSDDVTATAVAAPDYQLMVDSIADAEVIMLDRKGTILTWNHGAARLKGCESADAVGQHVSIFYTDEDVQAGLAERELEQAAASGRYEGEGWRKRRGGTKFWASVVLQPMYTSDGDVTGFVKITRDLTAAREKDEELRAAWRMLDAMTDYEVIMLGPDGTICTWNQGARLLKGYTAEEAIGQNVSIFYADEDVQAGLAGRELQQAAKSGRYEGEGWRLRKDGSRFWANVIITPLRDAQGDHIGFVKVTRDLTDRVEREKLVQRQRDEILELSTPVMQVWDRVLVLPIIGTLDSVRAARLTESLLERIASDQAAIVILDISGVPMIDTAVAQHMFKTIQGAQLMGAQSIISGVRPETAQAMVHLGIDIGSVRSRSTLRDALQLAFRMLTERSVVPEVSTNGNGKAPAISGPLS